MNKSQNQPPCGDSLNSIIKCLCKRLSIIKNVYVKV